MSKKTTNKKPAVTLDDLISLIRLPFNPSLKKPKNFKLTNIFFRSGRDGFVIGLDLNNNLCKVSIKEQFIIYAPKETSWH